MSLDLRALIVVVFSGIFGTHSASGQILQDQFNDGLPGLRWNVETANPALSVREQGGRLEFVATSDPSLLETSFAGYVSKGWQVGLAGPIELSAGFRQVPSGTLDEAGSVSGVYLQMTNADSFPLVSGIRSGVAILLGEARQPLPGLPRIRTFEVRRYDSQGNAEFLLSAFASAATPTVFIDSDTGVPLDLQIPVEGTLYLSYEPQNDLLRLNFSGFAAVPSMVIENARSGTQSPVQLALGGFARQPGTLDGSGTWWDDFGLWAGSLEEAPLNLQASRGTYSNRIRLTWEPASGSVGYRVFRQDLASPIAVLDATQFSFDDLDCPPAVEFGYVVESMASPGFPLRSTAVGWRNLPPPAALQASDGTNPALVRLEWSQVPEAIGYSVYRATLNGVAIRIGEVLGGIAEFEDTTGVPGVEYRYEVRSLCILGESVESATDIGWRPAPPISDVSASDGSFSDKVVINWAPRTGSLFYRVERTILGQPSPVTIFTVNANTLSYSDFGPSISYPNGTVAGVEYVYRVIAFLSGNPDPQVVGEDQGWRSPPPPANVQATDGTSLAGVNVTWNPVAGASGYNVYRASGSSPPERIAENVISPSFDSTAVPGTPYQYSVRARIPLGLSVASVPDTGWRNVPAPTGLVASQGTSVSGVELAWIPVDHATGYRILRGSGSAPPLTSVGTSAVGQFTDTTATPGITYTYAIRAITQAGDSLSGSPASGWRDASPVGNLTASDGTSLTSVNLSWSASAGASGYQIRRRESPAAAFITLGATSTTAFSDTSGSPGVPYQYAVFVNTPSGPSNTPPAVDSGWKGVLPPTGVQASDGSLATGIQVTWNPVPAALGYRVFRAAGTAPPILVDEVVTTSLLDDEATAGTIFTYSVRAVMPGGLTASSGTDTGWRNLPAPMDISATDGTRSDGIEISWSSVSGVVGYRVFRSIGNGTSAQVGQVTSSVTSYIDSSAVPGVLYTYTVRGFTSAGVTSPSNPDVGWRNVAAPSNVVATQTLTEGVRISWTASTGANGYTVYRGTSSGDLSPLSIPNASPFLDLETVTGVPYTYQVRARTALGLSAPSATVIGIRAIPSPSNVQASDGTSRDGILISWNPAPGASGYRVLRANGTATPSTPIVDVLGQVQYLDTTAPVGAIHNYAVQALVGGVVSPVATPNTGWRSPDRPTGVTATDGTRLDGVLVRWIPVSPASGITSYRIFRTNGTAAAVQVGSVAASADSHVDTTAVPGTSYLYTVLAATAAGNGSPSDPDAGWRNVAPPGNFLASDGTNVSGVQLTWQPSPGATGYRVFRRVDGQDPFELLPPPTSTAFLDTTAEPGRPYSYFAKARTPSGDSVGTSAQDDGYRGLAAPTSIQASDGTSSNHVTVSWNGVPGISSYQVLRASGAALPVTVIATVHEGLSFDDVQVAPGIVQNYSVRAVAHGRSSPSGTANSGWRNLPAPTGLLASDGLPGPSVQLSWDAVDGASGYRVFRSVANGAPVQIAQVLSGTSHPDSGASPGVPYTYSVRAFSAPGNSNPSAPDAGWRDVMPPANLQASDGTNANGVNLTWNASSGAIGYRVYRSQNGSEPVELLPPPSGTTFLDTTAWPTVIYSYVVRARTAAGDSPRQSVPENGFRGLTAPTGIAASDGTEPGGVHVTWNPIPGISTYRVLRANGNALPTAVLATVSQPPFVDENAAIGSTFNYTIQAELNSAVSPSGVPNTGYRGILAPTGVNAGDGTLSSAVLVRWNPVPGATEYRVFRSGTTQPIATVTSTSHEDIDAAVGTVHSYSVRAYYAPGNLLSTSSVTDTGWRNAAAPGGVAATDGSLVNGVQVTWTQVTPSNGVTGYRVFRSVGSAPAAPIATVGTNASSYLDVAAVPGTVYSYTVRTRTAAGDSEPSNTDSGWRDLIPTPSITASDGTSTSHVAMAWPAVAGATGFVVYRGENGNELVELGPATTNAFNDMTATPGRKYFYQVAARSGGGVSNRRSPVNDGWRNVPAPVNVQASDGTSLTSVTVTWEEVEHAVGYRVFRGNGSATPTMPIADLDGPSVVSHVDASVTPGAPYTYMVKAKVAVPGDSAPSGSNAGHAGVAPPTNVIASDGTTTTGVSINWNGISPTTGLTGYRIYRSGTSTAIATVSPATQSHVDQSAAPGQVFTYTVKSVCAAGESLSAPSDSGWRNLPAPTNVQATDGLLCGRVRISWTPVTNPVVTAYEVFRSDGNGESVSIAIVPSGGTTSALDFPPSTPPGTVLTYRVRALMHALATAESPADPGSPGQCMDDQDSDDHRRGDLWVGGESGVEAPDAEPKDGNQAPAAGRTNPERDDAPRESADGTAGDHDPESMVDCEEACARIRVQLERIERDPTCADRSVAEGLLLLLECDHEAGEPASDACRILSGDVNLDGTVSFEDFESFILAWAGWDLIHGDLDRDGWIDDRDFVLMSRRLAEAQGDEAAGME